MVRDWYYLYFVGVEGGGGYIFDFKSNIYRWIVLFFINLLIEIEELMIYGLVY